jgi:Carboxypeptidase regulatory-like domain/TonB-dependent Receptor Plug Domain
MLAIHRISRSFYLLAALLSFVLVCAGQVTSGSIAGVVKDSSGALVPNAKVTITSQEQGFSRTLTTGADGSFFADPLQPGTFTLAVEAQGFKRQVRKDVKLFANDHLAFDDITLEVGGTAETVTVSGEAVQLQTEDAMRSGVLTGSQTVNLALNGRNYLDLIKTVPGIVSDFNGQVAGPGGLGSIYANGQRGDQNNVELDGVGNVDTGSNGTQHTSLNVDAVSEFRVITNSESAEFGRSTGAAINIITRGGTRDFHGTGYWFHRNEGLNADSWKNNAQGIARNKYRYNYQGYNIGGPVYIPGHFNKDKQKLFFFFGQEWQRQLVPNGQHNVTVPTPAERIGDFSATHDASGNPVIIINPLTGAPFMNGMIPKSQQDANGIKILNFYPQPNVTGHPDYNYTSQVSAGYPRRQEVYRGDWNINDKWRFFARVVKDADLQLMPYGQWNASYNIPFGNLAFGQPGYSTVANVTTVINPSLTNELVFGFSHNFLTEVPTTDVFSSTKLGLTIPLPFPKASPLDLIPNFHYNVPNSPTTDFAGTPFINYNNTMEWHDNLSKVLRSHRLKAGIYWQRSAKDQTATVPANSIIDFSRNASNPGDTNWAFSNALIGNFNTFQQANHVLNGQYRYNNVEWYVLDSWKASRKLTIEYGMRFYIVQPQYDQVLQTSSFNPSLFDPAQSAVLYGKNAAGLAVNPLNGQTAPAAFIAALVTGTGKTTNGLYTNGIAQAGKGYPQGLIDSRGVQYAPRLGVAYNIFPKTVIRVGGGIFYDRLEGNPIFDQLGNPPGTSQPTIYYGNIETAASTPGIFFPATLHGFDKHGQVPTTYNYNFSVQQELPFRFLMDLAYVGSVSNHLVYTLNLNANPFGSAWLPQNQDPQKTPKFDGTTTLPNNLFRPYPGYGDILMYDFGSNSNYNAFQASLNRRLSANFQVGFAYTWSKAMGVAGANTDSLNPLNYKKANYAPLGFDHTHIAVINYIYNLPKLAKPGNFLNNPIGRGVLNNWVLSGITTFESGYPTTIGYSINNISSTNLFTTGTSSYGPRVVIQGNPTTGGGSTYQFINSAVFHPAQVGSVGMDSGARNVREPGWQNWDISVFKEFPFWKEGDKIQLRLEMFNAWNHTEFNGFNNTINFASIAPNAPITNLSKYIGGTQQFGFGAMNSVRDPRIIQLAAKIYF